MAPSMATTCPIGVVLTVDLVLSGPGEQFLDPLLAPHRPVGGAHAQDRGPEGGDGPVEDDQVGGRTHRLPGRRTGCSLRGPAHGRREEGRREGDDGQ